MTILASTRHRLPLLAAAQAQKELTHNEALSLIDLGLAPSVVTAGLNAPPPDPVPGQCWLVGPAPSGAWARAAGALACWTESGWRFLAPIPGMSVWIEDRRLWAVRDGGEWRIGEGRFDAIAVAGTPVLGARQPAVPLPAGGTTIDTEARAALADLVARLVAHGLIAP